MAARLGVEPRQNESESFVLPLHYRAGEKLGEKPFAVVAKVGLPGRSAGRTWVARLRPLNAGYGAAVFAALTRRAKTGAGDGIRTRNRVFTKHVLYH